MCGPCAVSTPPTCRPSSSRCNAAWTARHRPATMTRPPQPATEPPGLGSFPGARVLLLGTGSHDPDSGLPHVPAVRTTLTDLRAALTDRCGVPGTAIRVVADQPMRTMSEAIADAVETADGLLIIYFVGHGLVTADGQLHLATRD